MKPLMLLALTSLTAFAALDAYNAREHYLQSASGDSAWTGVRTSIQLRRAGTDQNAVREVGEGATFKSGDRFRIRLQTNADGYVYLLSREQDRSLRMVYPDKSVGARGNRFRAFEPRPIPSKGKNWLTFDDRPAIEGLFLLVSPQPIPELERLKQDGGLMSKADFDDLTGRNGKAVSMLYDEPTDAEGAIPATYYVEKRSPNRAFLFRQIDLVHKRPQEGVR